MNNVWITEFYSWANYKNVGWMDVKQNNVYAQGVPWKWFKQITLKKKKNKKQKQIQIRYIEGPLLYCFSRFFFLLYQLKIDIVVWENAKTTKKKIIRNKHTKITSKGGFWVHIDNNKHKLWMQITHTREERNEK